MWARMGNVRVKGEDGDDECDVRLMRRLKRRCIASGSFNAKVCDNSAKKTRNNSVKLEATPLYDKDYVDYVNYLFENDYDSDNGTDFNGKSVLDGHEKVKILENDDQDAGFWHAWMIMILMGIMILVLMLSICLMDMTMSTFWRTMSKFWRTMTKKQIFGIRCVWMIMMVFGILSIRCSWKI